MADLYVEHEPPTPGPRLPIWRVPASGRLFILIYSAHTWGVWTHWDGRRSDGCYSPREVCSGCGKKWPRRWKGYLHAWNYDCQGEGFAEVTPTTARQLADVLGGPMNLRGNRVYLERGRGMKARLKLTLQGAAPYGTVLPAPQTPEAVLVQLWGINQRLNREGIESPGTIPLKKLG